MVGRLEGSSFVALLLGSSSVDVSAIRARLEEMLDERNAMTHRGYDIRFSIGQIEFDPALHGSVEELLEEAEEALAR
ncbi:hypothetical protein D3C81_2291040 [compost metagenome]